MMRRSATGAVLVVTMLAFPAYGQTKLEWKFKEGEKFYQQNLTTQKSNMKMKLGGMDQDIKMNLDITQVTSMSVQKKNADGGAVIEQKTESVKVDDKSEGLPIGAMMEQMMKQMEGATFKFTLTPKGKITKFEGAEEFLKKIGGDDPMVAQMLKMMINEESLKTSAEQGFSFLPDKAVNKGDKWEQKQTIPIQVFGNMGTAATTNYTYQGKDTFEGKPVERISFIMNTTFTPPKDAGGGLPFQITKMDLKAEPAKGTILFDAAAGKLVQYETKVHMKGTMAMSVAGMDVEIDMDQEQTTKIQQSEKNPAK